MNLIEEIQNQENLFPKTFSKTERRSWGIFFYDENNPLSHDSNHALILDLSCNLIDIVQEIKDFYENLNITPRIYQSFIKGEYDAIKGILLDKGFKVSLFSPPSIYLIRKNSSAIIPRKDVQMQRITSIKSDYSTFLEPWTIGVTKNAIRNENFHLLGAFYHDQLVSIASILIGTTVARLDHVQTFESYRNQGFARSLIHEMLHYYDKIANKPFYLWGTNPVALKIYKEAGFEKISYDFIHWQAEYQI